MTKKRVFSEEHRRKLSEAQKGNQNGLGHTVTEEHKQKIREAQTGRKHNEETKRKISEAKKGKLGHEHTEESKLKISKSHKGMRHTEESKQLMSKLKKGSKHPQWKGGISFEPYCPKWDEPTKEKIRNKYRRRCFLCNKHELDNGRKLSGHHVNYDKDALCNGIKGEFVPLCSSCHARTNTRRDYWEVMIMYMIETDYTVKQRKMSLINLDE